MIDRTPLLTGGQAIIKPVDFEINGSEVVAFVDVAGIGDPPTVGVRATTDIWFTGLGTDAFFQPDAAPDVGLLTWPCNPE